VEFGLFTAPEDLGDLKAGDYVAVAQPQRQPRHRSGVFCDHYSKLAMAQHPELPREHRHLAWLPLDSEDGQEYWAAMELMGLYACRQPFSHSPTHCPPLESHRPDWMWRIITTSRGRERHLIDGTERDVVVHRKGATPAGPGVLGIIPGSMAAPAFWSAAKVTRNRFVRFAWRRAGHEPHQSVGNFRMGKGQSPC
jgi:tRNA-splicing ligase RtcB